MKAEGGNKTVDSGEIAPPGRYQCQVCGTRITIAAEESVPRCPFCHGTSFRHVHD